MRTEDHIRGIRRAKEVEAGEHRTAAREPHLEGALDFLRGRARPARPMIIVLIREHTDHTIGGLRRGVERICPAGEA